MLIEERCSTPDDVPHHTFELGQDVFDREEKKIGRVRARFSHYLLVERGGLFVKAYYIPQSVISGRTKVALHLSLSEDDVRRKGFNRVPDDLYDDPPAVGVPDITGVTQFVRGPGMNTDASGSYRREEVLSQPQRVVGEKLFTTAWPLPPCEVSSN